VRCVSSKLRGFDRDWWDPEVSAIIDSFLEANPGIDVRLISYANSARSGRVL
jgi:hypothetical protein